MNESKIGKYQFLAEPFHCDFSNHLFMGYLGNHLLNAADFHATERGFGMNKLITQNKTWVLSRLAIEITKMPIAYGKFTIETWVENAMRFFTSRNFTISTIEGISYGYGKSVWAMIDTETRQPVDIFSINNGAIKEYIDNNHPCPIANPSRVKIGDKACNIKTLKTGYGDVDINGHINSIKYIEHILDIFPIEWYKSHMLKRFDIAYVAEAYYGDSLSFYLENETERIFNIRITKHGESKSLETEVVRARIQFI